MKDRLCKILMRHGASDGADLDAAVTRALEQLGPAIAMTTCEDDSLPVLDVVRIRLGKLAAFVLPPALFRDPSKLSALRADLHTLSIALVGAERGAVTRFRRPR